MFLTSLSLALLKIYLLKFTSYEATWVVPCIMECLDLWTAIKSCQEKESGVDKFNMYTNRDIIYFHPTNYYIANFLLTWYTSINKINKNCSLDGHFENWENGVCIKIWKTIINLCLYCNVMPVFSHIIPLYHISTCFFFHIS